LGVDGAGEVLRLGVLPAFRGREYGRVLMEVAEEELVGAGVGVVELSIVRQFEGLHRYYEGLGYVGDRVERFESLPFEVAFMVKRVGGARVGGA
jgi:GNAT superfamily N-acetyltransferase